MRTMSVEPTCATQPWRRARYPAFKPGRSGPLVIVPLHRCRAEIGQLPEPIVLRSNGLTSWK
jgi:hypothetical protein